ncbi:MAG: RHS repeat-associated core domain-containing protein [Xanthomonadales bacterium]|nr:RHS repeat-associated core domain-containing protein [Xanthomonadales bacterium]
MRGRENLRRFTRALALLAWMLVLAPGSLLASWEAPRTDTDPLRHATTRSFDALNRLRSEASGSITRTQHFDGNGNRLTASLGGDTVRTQTYDPHNRPLSDQLQTANSDYTLTATRDANGNRTLSRDARNVATTHTYDAHDRLFTSSDVGGTTTNTWNADGTLARITQANGVETVYAYDGAKRITSITHRTNGIATLTFGYDYDGRGNRREEQRIEAALPGQAARTITTTHAYDRDDRLVRSTVTHQPANPQTPDTRTTWTLDDVGNRQSETVTELATNTLRANKTYTYNERDQLERITDPANDLQIDYAYDDNGNREQRIVRQNGVVTSQVDYTFDARDRLIQAQPNAPNEAIVQYQYDADDRRIARIETPRINGIPQTPITTRSIYDGSNLLHEADPAQITATYRRSAVLDRHIDHATNTVRHYQLDALRTPVAMTDAAGNTVTATTFDPWGNPTQQTASGTSTVPWQVPSYNPLTTGQAALLANDGQSIGFTGYGKDSATGLYYANARWYDPLVGSFNAMDPAAGIAAKPVTFHRYVYANGNPTYYVDRDGRQSLEAVMWNRAYGNPEYESAIVRSMLNQSPGLGRTAGVAMGAYSTASAPIEAVDDGVAALAGDAAASERTQLRIDGLIAEAGANAQSLIFLGGIGPGLRMGYEFVGGVAEHAGDLRAANANQDYVGEGEAGFKLTMDAAVVAGGARALMNWFTKPRLPSPTVAPDTSVAARTGVAVESPAGPGALPGRTVYVDTRGNAVVADAELPTNFQGGRVVMPEGHQLSARDRSLDAPPIYREGPFTATDREAFLSGTAGATKLAPHHRHQLPTSYGGVIDELRGPGHPQGNEHTGGTPNRHPNPSIFRRAEGGESLRGREIRDQWTQKGERMIEIEPGVWVDPGPGG